MTFVSVVLPAYKIKYLREAIISILNQTYIHFELIIVNDASPEDIDSIISSFEDERIKYFTNEINIGGTSLVEQWNHCISFAKGEYIVLAADDDIYYSSFLEQCITLTKKYPSVNIIRTGAEQIDENNNLIGIDGILPEYSSKYQFLYYWLTAVAFTCIGNYMFKAEVLKEKKFIDFPFAFGSDVASTIMMAENGIASTREMLFQFRISSIHLSSSEKYLDEKLEATTMLYTWLMNLNYERPSGRFDSFCYENTQKETLYTKCRYDYYNQVIKRIPFFQLKKIKYCSLLSNKDKAKMLIRYLLDRVKGKLG
ncbi:glycosyl transferase family 2 [Elizabethkingia sp. YR214]|uniref:glycosyltransferase family 2 protein n=1 Tax=Elizabethkingia sp. YR214 TaxID=2135667 RepID=UPI000D3210C4|nr:glycosyltransferase family 2 protein [Elizabethkingia sp. YR214]PUB28501.1 glycosyl transferase family 2 [Elizabethkingia sp. YR214]